MAHWNFSTEIRPVALLPLPCLPWSPSCMIWVERYCGATSKRPLTESTAALIMASSWPASRTSSASSGGARNPR